MKFHPALLATVSAVSAAALAGCDRRPAACASPTFALANPQVCSSRSGFRPGFYWGGAGARSGVSDATAGVSRGGFGATASGHGGGGGE